MNLDERKAIMLMANEALDDDLIMSKGPWEAYNAMCCPDMGGISCPSSTVMSACIARYGHPMTFEDAEGVCRMHLTHRSLAGAVLNFGNKLEKMEMAIEAIRLKLNAALDNGSTDELVEAVEEILDEIEKL